MHGEAVIISGVRTAVCKLGLGFKDVPAQRLGAVVIGEGTSEILRLLIAHLALKQ